MIREKVRTGVSVALCLAAIAVSLTALATPPANAATAAPGARMLAWAEANETGHWYAWGGTGLATYDCSGAVFRAAEETGLGAMPRDTTQMLSTGVAHGILIRTSRPAAGDLAFFGSGHVEMVARGHDVTFGALHTGTQVGYHRWYPGSGWAPSMYFRIT